MLRLTLCNRLKALINHPLNAVKKREISFTKRKSLLSLHCNFHARHNLADHDEFFNFHLPRCKCETANLFLIYGWIEIHSIKASAGVKSTEEPPWWREPLGIIAHMILFCSVVRKVPFNAQLDVLWSSSFLVSIRRRQLDIDVGLVRCVMKCLEYLRGCKILSTIEDSEMRESY